MKNILKKLIPPIFLDLLKKKSPYGFFGNYSSWNEAIKNSAGYDSPEILEKVKNSLLKVKYGEAIAERDSVILDKPEYSWPALAGLLLAASNNGNNLNVLDFGGSLGSSYFQNRKLLSHLNLSWNIVEQKNFVDCGKKNFEDGTLKFFYTIEDCLKISKPNVFFASSVIQYLEKPYEELRKILSYNFDYLIFDRTMFLENSERLTVQKVRPGIYNASYPAWFLNKSKCQSLISERYELIYDFDSLAGTKDLGDVTAEEKGSVWKIKSK